MHTGAHFAGHFGAALHTGLHVCFAGLHAGLHAGSPHPIELQLASANAIEIAKIPFTTIITPFFVIVNLLSFVFS